MVSVHIENFNAIHKLNRVVCEHLKPATRFLSNIHTHTEYYTAWTLNTTNHEKFYLFMQNTWDEMNKTMDDGTASHTCGGQTENNLPNTSAAVLWLIVRLTELKIGKNSCCFGLWTTICFCRCDELYVGIVDAFAWQTLGICLSCEIHLSRA